ncbi:helicase protein [Ancylostoma duodenale]|uniref:Helicase protein n=1 Tax=Ancylostoma duodenale TaxID=51022 RepID=A0A0C2GDP7_9BILA|nr:helicase protein [Ancylostoma duodenale]
MLIALLRTVKKTNAKVHSYLFSALPPSRQVAVFSATYPRNLDQLLSKFMRDASLVRLNSEDVQLIGIKQYVVMNCENVLDCLVRLLNSVQFNQALVFCNLHQQCEPTCSYLEKAGFLAASISAQISQSERDAVIEKLKQNKLKVLVSTDLTARGIDATNVNLVVNLETAINAETYFHRIGRAARYGGYGAAITIVADSREVGRFKAMVAKGGVNVRIMDLNGIPPDLTTNQSYFESCPVFHVAEPATNGLHTKRLEHINRVAQESDIPNILCDLSAAAITPPASGATYDRQTFMDLSKCTYKLSKGMLARINKIGISRVNLMRTVPSFTDEAADLNQQILKLKSANNVPLTQTFVPSREKAKKKFYMRGELLSIRDAVSREAWRDFASSKFDMSVDPFVPAESRAADQENNIINSNIASERVSSVKPVPKKEKKEVQSAVKCYTRKDLIAIQNSVPKKAWLPYVKSRWDTSQEPFQLNQYLRCSFEEQLRRKREIEKKQRIEVMKSRQKAQMEKPKLLAFARTPFFAPVKETSFETFCDRVKEEFDQFRRLQDAGGTNMGAVVPVRNTPGIWIDKVNYYTNWIRNFDATFKYDVNKEVGHIREMGTEVDVDETPTGSSMPSDEVDVKQSAPDSPDYDVPAEEQSSSAQINMSNEEKDNPVSAMSSEEEDHPFSANVDTVTDGISTSQSVPYGIEKLTHSTSEVMIMEENSLCDNESSALEESDPEEDSEEDEEEEQLRIFAENYRKNIK